MGGEGKLGGKMRRKRGGREAANIGKEGGGGGDGSITLGVGPEHEQLAFQC